jgi:glycosyltransferase involved in cell wall biosynthesis
MVSLSIVVPTYNRLNRLKQTLNGLIQQTYPADRFEVIVVSDGSTDGTSEYLLTLSAPGALPFQFRTILQKNEGVASARNHGYQAASGEWVLFIDDDIVPGHSLIEEHLRWHEKYGDKAVVIGPMISGNGHHMSPWVKWEQDQLARQYEAMVQGKWAPTARQFYTGNASLLRSHLVESKGFDASFRRAEDVELAYRLEKMGLHFYFNPDAISYHYPERSFKAWLDIPYAYGRNDVIFTEQKGQSWLLPLIFKEFSYRNLLVQALTWLCVGRPKIYETAISALKEVVNLGEALHFSKLSQAACSGLFNLRHYQGISDQLGGRKPFIAGLRNARGK